MRLLPVWRRLLWGAGAAALGLLAFRLGCSDIIFLAIIALLAGVSSNWSG